MKRRLIAAFALLIIMAGLLMGPDLFNAYQLDRHITRSSAAYDSEGLWPHLADACVSCHGVDGNSVNGHYPALAGQQADYLIAQLRRFASRERVDSIMNPMAGSLSDADIDALAKHFARKTPLANPYFDAPSVLQKNGERLVTQGACGTCHGNSLMGQAQFPRLAGQSYNYLLKQLVAFSTGTRQDPSRVMNQLAARWSPSEQASIAAYLASRPIAGGTTR